MTNNGSGKRSSRWIALACIASTALLLAACSSKSTNSSSNGSSGTTGTGSNTTGPTLPPPAKLTGTLSGPGVTATTITLGQITTTSGPVPGLFQGANDGLSAWAAWVNANGGIDGRQIKLRQSDDALNCNNYSNEIKQDAGHVFAMVGTFTLGDTCGKTTLQANPSLPDIQAATLDPTLYSIPNVFTPAPSPPGASTAGLQYFKHRFPKDITHTASLVGAAAAANGKEDRLTAESIGYKYVYTRVIGNSETNYTSDILRMKADGVKIVDLTAVAVGNDADFLQQAAQQNFKPDVIFSSTGYDPQLFKLLGNSSLADNVLYAPLAYALYLQGGPKAAPAVNTFLDWLPKGRSGATPNLFAVEAWAAGDLLLEAMRGAGPQITGSSVLSALKKITNFNDNGLIAPTDPGQKVGGHCVLIAQVLNGKWTRVHPSSGFDCSGTYHNLPLSAIK
ncbi:MAG: ABC transporter substrate-binding protein [Acidimicrobiaceae bacterium]|nr:ABC transporter substrate-binding protein [Acidimicrobiaceae bacterium]